jgi:hypothetical protein
LKTKLTLIIDESIIEEAKIYARYLKNSMVRD